MRAPARRFRVREERVERSRGRSQGLAKRNESERSARERGAANFGREDTMRRGRKSDGSEAAHPPHGVGARG